MNFETEEEKAVWNIILDKYGNELMGFNLRDMSDKDLDMARGLVQSNYV